jgi:hypothetical protein
MIKKNNYLFQVLGIVLFALCLVTFSACDKCESCNTTADFTMSEGYLGLQEYNEWEETDTVFALADVKFEAVCDDMTRYEWKIGTDTRTFTEPSFTLYFGTPGTTIDVKLKVYKDEDPNCPDNVVRVDSMTKKLTIIDYNITYIGGTYRGYNTDSPNHEFDVEIRFDSTEAILGAYVIHNLPEGCNLENSPFKAVTLFAFRERFFMNYRSSNSTCERPKGWGRLKEDRNTLVIDYYIKNFDTDKLEPYQFIGKRI